MIIKLSKRLFLVAVVISAAVIAVFVFIKLVGVQSTFFLGGAVGAGASFEGETAASAGVVSEDYSERFQRPSNQAALPNSYDFLSIDKNGVPVFQNPQDVLFGYYGVLKEASNMEGYTGGCGSIGTTGAPYPYAYQMLTKGAQASMTQVQFTDSFKGIGHITFLKVVPAYAPAGTPKDTKYFFVEIETITGRKDEGQNTPQPGLFAYYYGIATVKKEGGGWKIEKIDYLPEDFLCAPYHGWIYDSSAAVEIIYGDNVKLIDKVTGTEEKDGLIEVYATGGGKEYRFEYVRLTNGYDILLHEYVKEKGEWVETNLLKDPWTGYKLTAQSVKK